MKIVYQKSSYIVLTQKYVKSPLKHVLACYGALKLSMIQAQYFLQHRYISTRSHVIAKIKS